MYTCFLYLILLFYLLANVRGRDLSSNSSMTIGASSRKCAGVDLKVPSLFIHSTTFNAQINHSSSTRWDININEERFSTVRLSMQSNIRGELLFGGSLVAKSIKDQIKIFHWDSGHASLLLEFKQQPSVDIACVYMTVGFADLPKTSDIAVACPIPEHQAHILSTNTFHPFHQMSLIPSHLILTVHSIPHRNGCQATVKTVLAPAIFDASDISKREGDKIRVKSKHAVVTVQTFRNQLTGPMLYMFTKHYQRLGYHVIIFDRFGNHKDIFARDQFADMTLPEVYYYNFTILEQMLPNVYNESFKFQQPNKILRNRGYFPNKKMPMVDESFEEYVKNHEETSNQDSDKRKTFQFARYRHTEFDAMFYVDRDEFLNCSPVVNDGDDNVILPMTLSRQATLQHDIINRYIKQSIEKIVFDRRFYGSRIPLALRVSEKRYVPARMVPVLKEYLSQCLQDGYAVRNMSQLWHCWSSHYTDFTSVKSGDIRLGKVCPFITLHEPCLRCSCTEVLVSSKEETRELRSKCYFMHLNDANRNHTTVRNIFKLDDPVNAQGDMWI